MKRFSKRPQSLNVRSPREVTPIPSPRNSRPVQPLNVPFPREVTLSGILTRFRLVQSANTLSEIPVKEAPSVTPDRPVQY